MKTYYVVIDDAELNNYRKSNYQTLKFRGWEAGLPRVHQHLHWFERPQSTLDYIIAVISNSRRVLEELFHTLRSYTYLGFERHATCVEPKDTRQDDQQHQGTQPKIALPAS